LEKLKQQLNLGRFVASDAKFPAISRMCCMKTNHIESHPVFILPASQSRIRASKGFGTGEGQSKAALVSIEHLQSR